MLFQPRPYIPRWLPSACELLSFYFSIGFVLQMALPAQSRSVNFSVLGDQPSRGILQIKCTALVLLVPQDVLHSPFLPALAIYMLLLFELEAGIASACILSSGIIVLLITVTHALVRASQVSRRSRSEVSHTLYENDSAQHGESSTSDLNNKSVAAPRPRPEIHREFSFPPFLERKSQLGSPASSNLTSSGSPELRSEKESYNLPRTHRTLSAESGLLQAQGKPWNSITQEMRNVLSRKPGASGKDSTLV